MAEAKAKTLDESHRVIEDAFEKISSEVDKLPVSGDSEKKKHTVSEEWKRRIAELKNPANAHQRVIYEAYSAACKVLGEN